MFLSEQAVKFLINELLTDYFNSVSYKIMLCLACFKEKIKLVDDIIKISKKSQSKRKKKKSFSKIKIKKKLKIKFEFQDLFIIKILFLKYITIIFIVLILFIEKKT